MIDLTGSEKQIKWATEIRSLFFTNMNELLNKLQLKKGTLKATGNIGGANNHEIMLKSLTLFAEKAALVSKCSAWIDQRDKLMDLFTHRDSQDVMTYEDARKQIFNPPPVDIRGNYYRMEFDNYHKNRK